MVVVVVVVTSSITDMKQISPLLTQSKGIECAITPESSVRKVLISLL